jgi:heme exporter protein C
MKHQIAQAAKLLLGLMMTGVILAMFLIVPQYAGLGDAGRIIIMHVPTSWVSVMAFTVSAIFSALYLWRRKPSADAGAVAAAELGFIFCVLATVTGAIFAQVVWGTFWNWDPRQTTILILLLIYAAYFALRSSLSDISQRRRLSAVYNIFAGIIMPFLMFVAPRMADSTLHPNCAFIQGSKCDGISLQLNGAKIGQLGDNILELKGLEQRDNLIVAQVEVRTPGLREIKILEPSYDLDGFPADRPVFPGQFFVLMMTDVDPDAGTASFNMEAPGTKVLNNQRTLWPFLASNLTFSLLFVWILSIRSTMLQNEDTLMQREGLYA